MTEEPTCYLHLLPCRWKEPVSQEVGYGLPNYTVSHPKKRVIFIVTAVRTSNLTKNNMYSNNWHESQV
jgi:hypothetical protein